MRVSNVTWLAVTTLSSPLTNAFVLPLHHHHHQISTPTTSKTCLSAENGVPQYDKIEAVLREAELVGEGSVMLHIDISDDSNKLDYEPGHVLALEVKPDDEDVPSLSEYNAKVAKNNNGWMRGPYTVSRATETSIDILIRILGNKSHTLAKAKPGRPLKFGGQFKVPIAKGVAEHARKVVLISTGVGIGPCIGAIEQMLSAENQKFASTQILLLPHFREEPEIVYREYLNELANKDKRFKWKPIVTSQTGRLSASEENLALLFDENQANGSFCSVSETHYHVIGNGQLVNEFKQGLAKAGVSESLVTEESYFNHQAKVEAKAVENIAKVVASKAKVPASDV